MGDVRSARSGDLPAMLDPAAAARQRHAQHATRLPLPVSGARGRRSALGAGP